jgi:hypothetical protein
MIVFKGTANGRIAADLENYPAGAVYQCQEKAWNDETTCLKYVDCFNILAHGDYLLWDAYKTHMMGSVRQRLASTGSECDIILPGYTAKLQVLDVGVNKPFKDHYRRQYIAHLDAGGGKPTRQLVAQWIIGAWDSITVQTITNTWASVMGDGPADV